MGFIRNLKQELRHKELINQLHAEKWYQRETMNSAARQFKTEYRGSGYEKALDNKH